MERTNEPAMPHAGPNLLAIRAVESLPNVLPNAARKIAALASPASSAPRCKICEANPNTINPEQEPATKISQSAAIVLSGFTKGADSCTRVVSFSDEDLINRATKATVTRHNNAGSIYHSAQPFAVNQTLVGPNTAPPSPKAATLTGTKRSAAFDAVACEMA